MARNNQFLNLVTMLRSELGRSANVAVGVADITRLKYQINKAYSFLYKDHDWPHLMRLFTPIELQAGQRYYDLPAELNYDRIDSAYTYYGSQPQKVFRGIDMSHYSAYNSEQGARSSPAMRYDLRDVGGDEQIEAWPIPSTNTDILQFYGIRAAPTLVNDADLCLLDDYMVVLKAAFSLTTNADDRRRIAAEFTDLYTVEKANSKSDVRSIRLGLGQEEKDHRLPVVVRVGS